MLLVDLTEGRGAGFGYRLVLLARTAADANRTDDFSGTLERHAASEDHDAAIVGSVDAEEVAAGLREGRQIAGGNIKGTGGEGFLDRNVDAAEPRAVHAHVSDEISAAIRDGDIHWLANRGRFLLRGAYHFHCVVQRDHREAPEKRD